MTSGSGDISQAITELWHDGEVTPVHSQLTGMDATLSGVIASAASAAPQRRRQIVAINQRPIATRGFIARLLDELLPPQRQHYPAVVLHFQLPSDSIDINMRAGKRRSRHPCAQCHPHGCCTAPSGNRCSCRSP
jgi:DNA mismatch repair ATPase MutL